AYFTASSLKAAMHSRKFCAILCHIRNLDGEQVTVSVMFANVITYVPARANSQTCIHVEFHGRSCYDDLEEDFRAQFPTCLLMHKEILSMESTYTSGEFKCNQSISRVAD
ncbi:hypothetical protein L9F63_024828, partial [Diploptera punctata]